MDWILPGTVLARPREDAQYIAQQFDAMFLPGGMTLHQVTTVTGLDGYLIQNWVRRGFLTAPRDKRYSQRQLCRILNINMLRPVLPLERICSLLGYVNGQLDDEGDDMINDAHLYFIFVRLAANAGDLYNAENREAVLEAALADYKEPVPGAQERVKEVLRVMLTAWLAARMTQEAENMLINLERKD